MSLPEESEGRLIVGPPPDGPDAEAHLRRVIEILEGTRTIPLSSSVKLDNKDEVLELLDEAIHRLPDELRAARWLMKDREEYLAKMRRDGDDILESARLGAERMVQRTEIVREAQHTARRLVEEAREESRRLRMEAEDYCDQKLAAFEIVLERTIKTVAAGRQKLSLTPAPVADLTGSHHLADQTLGGRPLDGEEAFFDQDRLDR